MSQIELKGITKVYASAVTAVADVNLVIASGEFFFLLGPSGCGKTTLLRMIAGLIEPSAGTILFGGKDVTALPVEKRNTAMVFQNYALWPHMTVGQNVEFGPKMKGLPADQRRALALENLTRVQMQDYLARRPNQLSGGQQQRVALARALAAGPDCLLLDEPLSNLDARLRLHMRGELRGLVKSSGTTGIYVTHDQKEALSMADRIAVMNEGRIVQVGPPEELYHRPATRFVADFLGEANFIDGKLVAPGRVETPAGEMHFVVGDISPGRVTCCVRPEYIRIGLPGAEGEFPLAAKVESRTFLGETVQYLCRLNGGQVWKVTALAAPTPAAVPGQDVKLCIRPDVVAVLPAMQ